jgi:O-methyltransferase / aklanonic acid methyltransferase
MGEGRPGVSGAAPRRALAGLFGRAAAAGYDQVGFFHQVARRLLTLAGARPGMRVLDVACGAGAVLVEAAHRVGPTGVTVGVDLAEPMAAAAARRLRRLGRARGAVAVMDAERLGLRDASFDLACCASAIYLLGDQAAAVRAWRRVLRPGGTLAVSEFGDLDARWAWKDELLARFGPPLAPLGAGHLGRRELRRLLRSAGAGTVTVTVERLDVAYADFGAWWAQQWAHGERRPLERMGSRALAAYRAAAAAAVEGCREADGALHWRPEVVYAVGSGGRASPRRRSGAGPRRRRT